MLGWGRKAAIEMRAKLLARMTALILHGLQTKSYEQFSASFSNPGWEPDTTELQRHELRFLLRISRTCEYYATACYPRDEPPWAFLQGDGDDFGVYINLSQNGEIGAGLHLGSGEPAGRDAQAMVGILTTMPGFKSFSALE
jgi:hypothetical protein